MTRQLSFAGGREYAGNELPQWALITNRLTDENTLTLWVQGLNTPLFTIVLEGRPDPTAPWFTLKSFANTDLVSGVYTTSVSTAPQMRLRIASLGNTTCTTDVWITE
jgi:hypothetical protein